MIIPVRCFTCHKVLADKWDYYVKRCHELEKEVKNKQDANTSDVTSIKVDENLELERQHFDKTVRQRVFEELKLDRLCCRRMLLGHVDLIDIV